MVCIYLGEGMMLSSWQCVGECGQMTAGEMRPT